jgi:hypothetical protein
MKIVNFWDPERICNDDVTDEFFDKLSFEHRNKIFAQESCFLHVLQVTQQISCDYDNKIVD